RAAARRRRRSFTAFLRVEAGVARRRGHARTDAAGQPLAATVGRRGPGQSIGPLAQRPGQPITIVFMDDRIVIDGGCNALRGAFKVDAAKLEVGRTISTMMACEPALMATDAALAKLVEAPLQIAIDKGSVPLMRLVSSSNNRLVFAGTPTPESLY